eukprot:GHVT01067574.1.p2 GENE.GHVT01067574.1~~GHVT01067574.1.p2  ORF type:complete len:115 (+),score=21.02 GHVT01067574.1:267-611(+)
MSSSPNRNFLTTPPPPIASPVFPSAPASSISVAAPLPGVPPVAATSLSGPFPTSPGPRGTWGVCTALSGRAWCTYRCLHAPTPPRRCSTDDFNSSGRPGAFFGVFSPARLFFCT